MWIKNNTFAYPYTNIRTAGKSIEVAPIPAVVKIPLLSAKGKVGICTVSVGDKVTEGSVIGKSGDFAFYASISGEVKDIVRQEIRVNVTSILDVPVVEIHFGGRIMNWEQNTEDYLNRSSEELRKQILSFGVENLNPTSCLSIEDILNFPKGAHLVVSAMELSPMVTFLEEILLQKQEQIHTAMEILEYIIQPKQTTILVGAHLKNHYRHPREIVQYLEDRYPNGHESRIFHHFTQMEKTSRDLLLEKGYVIIDVQTLLYLYNAVVLKKPFMDVLVTLEGKLARNPGHYFVRLGTPIRDLIEDIGVYERPKKIVSGSIFLSNIIYNVDSRHISPDIYSLILSDEEFYHYRNFENCIQCNLCHLHCPVSLYPCDLAFFSLDQVDRNELSKCLNCGICSYICPSRIALGYFLELQKEGKNHG